MSVSLSRIRIKLDFRIINIIGFLLAEKRRLSHTDVVSSCGEFASTALLRIRIVMLFEKLDHRKRVCRTKNDLRGGLKLKMANYIYIATSLDGYIATPDGGVEWLNDIPNPDKSDFGFADFMDCVDCLLMGRRTYEAVLGFGGTWPYHKKVYVLSHSLRSVPDHISDQVELVSGSLPDVLEQLKLQGIQNIYIDGGQLIQSALQEDLIDQMVITRVPVLLGGGIPLFGKLLNSMKFCHLETEVLAGSLVKSSYQRVRGI